MEVQEVNSLLEELAALIASQESADDDAAIEPVLLNAVADYVEGADPTGTGLDSLRKALETAAGEADDSTKHRMRAAGCRRALRLLHETITQA
ncbi:hypothetical protein LSCM1_02185 [Leishmania martiniquensis]|uniref:Uncharacterized protein n=1 Tax=Leishmania martiniquensis TaxID=1580590 RepID=A0A836G809_9TRYP|nr:hypothetical protein LSCM1_02185 [Leishmania martiniquensis]